MTQPTDLDQLRRRALDRVEQTERRYKAALFAALFLETVFIGLFLLLADFRDRLHVLLLFSSVAIYTILGFGLFALGAHVSRSTLLVLKAIELFAERDGAQR
jgi:hypothetical protein